MGAVGQKTDLKAWRARAALRVRESVMDACAEASRRIREGLPPPELAQQSGATVPVEALQAAYENGWHAGRAEADQAAYASGRRDGDASRARLRARIVDLERDLEETRLDLHTVETALREARHGAR